VPGRSLTSIAARLKRARESEEQQRRERTRATPGARLVSEAPAVLQQREVLASLPPNRQTTGSAGEKAIRIESDEARIAAALLSLQRAEQRQPPPAARIVPLLSGARGGAGMAPEWASRPCTGFGCRRKSPTKHHQQQAPERPQQPRRRRTYRSRQCATRLEAGERHRREPVERLESKRCSSSTMTTTTIRVDTHGRV